MRPGDVHVWKIVNKLTESDGKEDLSVNDLRVGGLFCQNQKNKN